MHRLKVRRHKVCIPPRHLQRGMTKDLLQIELGAAALSSVESWTACPCSFKSGSGRIDDAGHSSAGCPANGPSPTRLRIHL